MKRTFRRGAAIARFVCSVVFVACGSPEPGAPPSEEGPDRRFSVFLTGNIEGALEPCQCPGHPPGGRGRRVAARMALKGNVLWMDAGARGTGQADPVPWERAFAERRAFHAAQSKGPTPDVLAVTAEDLAFGLPALRSWATATDTRLVSANLQSGKGSDPPPFELFAMFDRGGVKIAVVGAASVGDEQNARRAYRRAGLRVLEPAGAVAQAAAAARAAGAEWVLAAGDASLTKLSGLDFVVVRGEAAGVVGDDRFVGLGRRGRYVGQADVRIGSKGAELVTRLIALDSAKPEDSRAAAAARVQPQEEMRNGALRYAGTGACVPCHRSQVRQWKKTAHAEAWNGLIAKRQTRNFDCAPCHGTGFLWPGGPTGFGKVRKFMHVGCEACHGPARGHVEKPEAPFSAPATRERCEVAIARKTTSRRTFTPDRMEKILGPGHGRPRKKGRRRVRRK